MKIYRYQVDNMDLSQIKREEAQIARNNIQILLGGGALLIGLLSLLKHQNKASTSTTPSKRKAYYS